jgi:hypothetical protein
MYVIDFLVNYRGLSRIVAIYNPTACDMVRMLLIAPCLKRLRTAGLVSAAGCENPVTLPVMSIAFPRTAVLPTLTVSV